MKYGYRARIGYTSPPLTTEVFPYEFYLVVPKGVTLVLTTLAVVELSGEEVDRSYDITLTAVDAMKRAGVDVMVLGGVPINISRGFANAADLIRDVEQKMGIPVTSSIASQVAALRQVGAKRVAIGHPFPSAPGKVFPNSPSACVDLTKQYDFELAGVQGLNRPAIELGQIATEDTMELGRSLLRQNPKADTIWLPCPHWACAEAIDPLEKELGVNVISAHQAIVWNALRLAGVKDKIAGFGRLLRDA